MAGARQPIELIQAKGAKHLGKQEIRERQASEVHGCTDEIAAPAYLPTKLRKRFDKLAGQLLKIKIMGETDCDTLARYVLAEQLYEQSTQTLLSTMAGGDLDEIDTASKIQDRYYKQAQTAAASLGLTISSRCKLQVPVTEEEPKVNRFARFGKAANDE